MLVMIWLALVVITLVFVCDNAFGWFAVSCGLIFDGLCLVACCYLVIVIC